MRPERISKMISFLRDKEPLMYLFLLNANYEIIDDPNFSAGVCLKNGITIAIGKKTLERPINEFYFILVHEAQHIFKQHLHIFKKIYSSEGSENDRLLMNIANDAMINLEISNFDFSYFKELTLEKVFINGCVEIADEYNWYLSAKNVRREDGYTSSRYYNWLKENKAEVEQNKEEGTTTLKIKGFYSGSETFVNVDDYDKSGAGEGEGENSENEGEDSENEEDFTSMAEVESMLNRMLNQAQKMETELYGKGSGNMSQKIRSVKKSEVNWKTELRKRINYYNSKNGSKPTKKLSYLTYLSNPKSMAGNMLFPSNMKQRNNLETAVILALDTSGSCFFNESEIESFFTEIDAISKELERSKKGGVYVMQWDYTVQGDIVKYKKGDYKNFEMKGGGGTCPEAIFDFLSNEKITTQNGNNFKISNGDLNIEVEGVKKLPLVIVLTDGYFSPFKRTGIYEKCRNVLFFTRESRAIVDDTDYITYK